MKNIVLLALFALSLAACGREVVASNESVAACQAPADSVVPGQIAIAIRYGTNVAKTEGACNSIEILAADLATVMTEYSACTITQSATSYLVDCFAITDGVTNHAPHTGWNPPYKQ